MLTKSYIDEELKMFCAEHDEICDDAAASLANWLYIKKNFHLLNCDEEFSHETAEEWVAGMENSDKTKGAHWTKEQTTAVLHKLGARVDPCMFWAVMNSIYSDYGATLTQAGVLLDDIYGKLALDWICDEDAVDNKAAMYYEYIVDHD